ncbi:MAG: type II toxin-antitoxin system HicB family antitoxin, partial [Nitrospirae bacterium]|nr:type II toxin-antitoxin system HicB family antitoxin [Nitrospirota bacterium]
MQRHYVITDYIEGALESAVYDKLEDASFSGRIPLCTGVIAFGTTLRECE